MAAWLQALTEHEQSGEPAVLITLLSIRGSAPREAGCKMVVGRDGVAGTIGGGNLEFQCTALARTLLDDGTAEPEQHDFPLGPKLGQCCGGHVTVLFEPIRPAPLQIALFGAGHVGRALVRLLGDLPCQVSWFDSRPDAFPDAPAGNVSIHHTDTPQRHIPDLPAGSFVLVMTHDHQIDFNIVASALRRDDFLGTGLIGSVTKRARFLSRLRREGLPESALNRLICPIGVPGIESKQPEAIAIAIAAQILQGFHTKQRGPQVESKQPVACDTCFRAGTETCA